MTQNLTLELAGLELSVRSFSVVEELSRPFEICVWARRSGPLLDLEGLLAGPAKLGVWLNGRARTWEGGVCEARLVRAEPTGESTYFVRVVPWLWFAGQSRTRRVFQHATVPAIVLRVLAPYRGDAPLSEEPRGRTYPAREYVVQADESDLDFVSRLLEREGITYHFRFGERTLLVLAGKPHEATPRTGEAIGYTDEPHPEGRNAFVTKVRLAHRVRPGKVTLRDYDFRNPSFPLFASEAATHERELRYEHYYYAPGAFLCERPGQERPLADDRGKARHDADEGAALAARRLVALRQGKRSLTLVTNQIDLAPGVVFEIQGHPHKELGASGDSPPLLCTAARLRGGVAADVELELEAAFASDGWQPALVTPEPRFHGVASAVVAGTKKLDCDEYGRVRVAHAWDREATGADASCRQRVSQPWAGSGYGAMFVPRFGQEVLVRCFEGNPDLPAVVGRGYHRLAPVPYPLDKHRSKSACKTQSLKAAADGRAADEENAYNELRLDDYHDHELVYLQAQKDRQTLVKHDQIERTGESRVAVVGGSRSSIVGQRDTRLVGVELSVQMIAPPSREALKLEAQKMPDLAPQPTKLDMVDKHILVTTAGATLEMDDGELVVEAKGELSIRAGGNVVFHGGPLIKINS
ncbi:MAG: type VI secretion system tip protein VgrG [Myxococcales bacterium]|nr:type VI secretion system tip protein VgrG [Myxococcales bacterium]